jgi:hypothetical protein
MTTKAPISRRLTRYLAGPALALGLAIGAAGVANAVWDIEAYDACMKKTIRDPLHCCVESGGVWPHREIEDRENHCVAPPPESQAQNPLPGGAPTHVMQPLPLPGQGPDIGPATGEVG